MYIVTGATGWVGKNLLHCLQKIIDRRQFNNEVFCFANKKRKISSTAYREKIEIPIIPLSEINNIFEGNSNLKIIHTAFLTREKIKDFGKEEYIRKNQSITNLIENLLIKNYGSRIVIISSGAARNYDANLSECKLSTAEPYSFLKREEEIKLSKISDSLILRIFALTGKFIRDPEIFALGNFLISAKQNKAIKILSKTPVSRSYVFAADIADLSIKWLNSSLVGRRNPIAAVSETIDLLTLANKISKIYDLPNLKHNINFDLDSNDYVASTDEFKLLLNKFNLKATSLEDQIKITFNYLKDHDLY